MKEKKRIAVSMGDPGGIGSEIILKALSNLDHQDICWVVVGSETAFRLSAEKMKFNFPFTVFSQAESMDFKKDSILLNIDGDLNSSFDKGKISKANATLAMKSLEVATGLAIDKKVQALCTAPINKTSMRLIVPDFIGHTEFLAERAKSSSHAMAFFSPKLKIVLATIHVALKDVARTLTQENIYEKIILMHDALRQYLSIQDPRIAVCALNPHGRETGSEEDEIIMPAVKKAKSKNINVVGPFSADQLFYEAYAGNYDAVVSMYHDQGLVPFKMVSFHDGVNVTLGLPFVRTSPDHGTAFDIAFQNKADSRSMESAMNLAAQFVVATNE